MAHADDTSTVTNLACTFTSLVGHEFTDLFSHYVHMLIMIILDMDS